MEGCNHAEGNREGGSNILSAMSVARRRAAMNVLPGVKNIFPLRVRGVPLISGFVGLELPCAAAAALALA